MSSTRLPHKVLMPLVGKPVLQHVVSRLMHCKTLDAVVVATSTDPSDDAIAQWCQDHQLPCFRGSHTDVLDRYYQAALRFQADAIVRITADCPAIDPVIVDEVVEGFWSGDYDSYSLAGEFPDGLDCQVFSFEAIAKAWREATLPSEREHVGPYIEKTRPDLFKSGQLIKFKGLAHHRWTLDEPRDHEFLQAVFSRLHREDKPFQTAHVLDLLEREPSLMRLNSGIVRNAGYWKSVQEEQA